MPWHSKERWILYFLIPIYYTIAGTIFGKRETAALEQMQAGAAKTIPA
jgi:hypothetical protein